MISIESLDYNKITPENIFEWLELFAFKRYGVRHHIDPSKADDPRYASQHDGSPIGWYTHFGVPSRCYDKTHLIIDLEQYEKIKEKYKEIIVREEQS